MRPTEDKKTIKCRPDGVLTFGPVTLLELTIIGASSPPFLCDLCHRFPHKKYSRVDVPELETAVRYQPSFSPDHILKAILGEACAVAAPQGDDMVMEDAVS